MRGVCGVAALVVVASERSQAGSVITGGHSAVEQCMVPGLG